MDSESTIEQFVRNLSFGIETDTQNNPARLKYQSKSAPLNVKVRIRKKDMALQNAVISIPKPYLDNERIRLANSDQTIMSFDLFMEPDLQKKPAKKNRRKLLEIIRQGTCLGTLDNDETLSYLPSSLDNQTIREERAISKSDGVFKQHVTLSKRNYVDSSSTLSKNNYFLGKCKPGGCLDPQCSDDMYSYTPTIDTLLGPDQKSPLINTNTKKIKHKINTIEIKKKSTDPSIIKLITNEPKDTNSVLKLYEAGSVNTSLSTTHSNFIITYPPTLSSSEFRIHSGKNMQSKVPTDANKNTVDQLSNAYFIPSKRPVKHLEDKKSEITLSFNQMKILTDNNSKYSIPNDDLCQNSVINLMHLDQATPFGTKVEGGHVDSKNESVKLNQHCDHDNKREISKSQLIINKLPGSVATELTVLALDDRSHIYEPYDYNKLELLGGITDSHSKIKIKMVEINQSEQKLKQTFESNNPYISTSPQNFNIDSRSKILQELNIDIPMNIAKDEPPTLDMSLIDIKILKKGLDESISNIIEQLIDEKNTGKSIKNIEPCFKDDSVKDISDNESINSFNFIAKTNSFHEQGLSKTPLESKIIIYSNDRNFDKNISNNQYIVNKQNDEKINVTVLENLKYLTQSDIKVKHSGADEEYDALPRRRTLDEPNLNLNHKVKSLGNHLESPENKCSLESIHSISHPNKTSDHKMFVKENIDSATDKSNLYIENSKSDYVSNTQVVTQISESSVNKEKECIQGLQDYSKMELLRTLKKQNITSELSVKVSSIQNPDTDFFHDKSRTTNPNYKSLFSFKLVDNSKQYSNHSLRFLGKEGITTGFVLPIHNDENKEPDMTGKVTKLNEMKRENKTFLNTMPRKNDFENTLLPESNSHIDYHAPNVPIPVIQSHKQTIESMDKLMPRSEIALEKLSIKSVSKTIISNTSIIYVNKQMVNRNPILSVADIEGIILDTGENKISETNKTCSSDTTVLETPRTQLQNQYSDIKNANKLEYQSTIVSYLPIESINVFKIEDEKNEISLDLAFRCYTNNKNQRFLQSFSSENEPHRYTHDTLLQIKTQMTSNCKLKIPIDTENDLLIRIDKINDRFILPQTMYSKGIQVVEEIRTLDNENSNLCKTIQELRYSSIGMEICEKELMALQNAIKDLKEEIDSLSGNQLILKNNLYSIKKTKSIRITNVGKRCNCFKGCF